MSQDVDSKLIEFNENMLIAIIGAIERHSIYKGTVFYDIFELYDRAIQAIYDRRLRDACYINRNTDSRMSC